jgi:tetratricopeptide (TPR) repeat protein
MSLSAVLAIRIALTAAPATAPPAPPLPIAQTRPRVTADDLTHQSGWWEPTDGKVNNLRKLLQVTPDDDPEKPHFWFHLGQTHAYWWWYLRRQARNDPQRQIAYERQALAHAAEAIKAYGAATAFKGYDRQDAVLFNLARMYIGIGDRYHASGYLYRLAAEHRRSRYVPQAAALLGDLLFAQGDVAAALGAYRKVESFPESFFFPYALYREGWCHLRQGDTDAAIAALLDALQASPVPPVRWPSTIDGVRRAARQDLARIGRERAAPR